MGKFFVRSTGLALLPFGPVDAAALRELPCAFPLAVNPSWDKRTEAQNRKLWPMLADVARQVEWYGQRLTDEEWKEVFTASLRRGRIVPGIDGGFVCVGQSTSRMNKDEFGDLLALVDAFGTERGVVWSEPKQKDAAA